MTTALDAAGSDGSAVGGASVDGVFSAFRDRLIDGLAASIGERGRRQGLRYVAVRTKTREARRRAAGLRTDRMS